jgi:thioredoxin 1
MHTKKLWIAWVTFLSLAILAGCANTQQPIQDPQELSDQELSAQVLEVLEPTVTVVPQEESQTQEDVQIVGLYTDYSAVAVDQALADGKKVAFFFHATRCPSCRKLDKNIENDLTVIPSDTVLFKVDYDRNTELKRKYEVTSQHTIVLIDANQALIKKSMWDNIKTLTSLLQ